MGKMLAGSKRKVRKSLQAIHREVIASLKRQVDDLTRSHSERQVDISTLKRSLEQAGKDLHYARNPPSVTHNGRPVPIASLADHQVLSYLHDCERHAMVRIETYDDGGKLVERPRGLTSPSYPLLVAAAYERGLIGVTRINGDIAMTRTYGEKRQ